MNKKRNFDISILIGIISGIIFIIATSGLFYDFHKISLFLVLFLPLFVINSKKNSKEKKCALLQAQFKDALQYIKNGVDSGESLKNAIKNAANGLKALYGDNSEITHAFKKMHVKIETGHEIANEFCELGKTLYIREAVEFAELYTILKRNGGNLSEVLAAEIESIRDRINLKRELNVTIAEKKGEFNIMLCIPYFILIYLKVFAADLTEPLYHNVKGIFFMTAMLMAYILLYLTGRTIIKRTMNI